MSEPSPLQALATKLLELRREDELRAVSTLHGSINALSHAVEIADPGVLLRTMTMFETWMSNRTVTENCAIVIHASFAMLAIVRTSNEGGTPPDVDDMLRKHAQAAATSAAKDRDNDPR